jgi:hypothetical protein
MGGCACPAIRPIVQARIPLSDWQVPYISCRADEQKKFATVEAEALKRQGIKWSAVKVICHEPVCVYTDGNVLAVTSADNFDSIVEIHGMGLPEDAVTAAMFIEDVSRPCEEPDTVPVAIVRETKD